LTNTTNSILKEVIEEKLIKNTGMREKIAMEEERKKEIDNVLEKR
jgi:predicted phage-related endonuclease